MKKKSQGVKVSHIKAMKKKVALACKQDLGYDLATAIYATSLFWLLFIYYNFLRNAF